MSSGANVKIRRRKEKIQKKKNTKKFFLKEMHSWMLYVLQRIIFSQRLWVLAFAFILLGIKILHNIKNSINFDIFALAVLRVILVRTTRVVCGQNRVAIHAWNIHLKRQRFVNQTSSKSACVTLSGSFSPIMQERSCLNFTFSIFAFNIAYIVGVEIKRATCFLKIHRDFEFNLQCYFQ